MLNLVWDLDGTLIDSREEVFACIDLAMAQVGIDRTRMTSEIRVGPTIDRMLRLAFPASELDGGRLDAAVAAFRKFYDGSDFARTTAFPGIAELVTEFTSYRHYIVTNKPDAPSWSILRKLGWERSICRLLTPDTLPNPVRKSKEELFTELLRSEGLAPSQTLGIGDMKADATAAQQAGIRAIGVLWGNGTARELSICDHLCRSVPELSDLLKELCQKSS